MGIPDRVKQWVFEEANFQCSYCGHRQGLNLTIHHIIPLSEDGDDSYENLIVLCHNCQQNLHNKEGIKDKDIRRLKRHLVARYLTQTGVNALKLAYTNNLRVVSALPVSVQHLIDMELLKFEALASGIHSTYVEGGCADTVICLYKITEKGEKLTE